MPRCAECRPMLHHEFGDATEEAVRIDDLGHQSYYLIPRSTQSLTARRVLAPRAAPKPHPRRYSPVVRGGTYSLVSLQVPDVQTLPALAGIRPEKSASHQPAQCIAAG